MSLVRPKRRMDAPLWANCLHIFRQLAQILLDSRGSLSGREYLGDASLTHEAPEGLIDSPDQKTKNICLFYNWQ